MSECRVFQPVTLIENTFRPYKCDNCGHEKNVRTNHEGSCLDYCENCSWKPSFGEGFPMFGKTYRQFVFNGKPGQVSYE